MFFTQHPEHHLRNSAELLLKLHQSTRPKRQSTSEVTNPLQKSPIHSLRQQMSSQSWAGGRPSGFIVRVRPRARTEAEGFCLQHPWPSRKPPRTTRAGASALFTRMQARGEPGRKLKLREGLRELAQRVLVADARDLLPLLAALVLLFDVGIFGGPRQIALEPGARRGGLACLLRAKHLVWSLIGRGAGWAVGIPPLLAFRTAVTSKARRKGSPDE